MTIFVLKKYSDIDDSKEVPSDKGTPVTGEPSSTEEPPEGKKVSEKIEEQQKKNEEKLIVEVTGSISGIIATALNKVLKNTTVEVDEVEKESEADNGLVHARIITTEDINNYPVETFNSIRKDCFLFISSEGFSTDKEEWFLINIGNRTKSVYYTLESFLVNVVKPFVGSKHES